MTENLEVTTGSSCEFISLLDRGGLKIPQDSLVMFVLLSNNLFDRLSSKKKCCRKFLNSCAYHCLANILLNNYSYFAVALLGDVDVVTI